MIKIFTAGQIKSHDSYTITHEPIGSWALMERAAKAITERLTEHFDVRQSFLFFIGKGNNAGDGLAVARMLSVSGFRCSVVMLYDKNRLTKETLENFNRLPAEVVVVDLSREAEGGAAELSCGFASVFQGIDLVDGDCVVVDAILGTGVRGEVTGVAAEAIRSINRLGCPVVSIDLPSGMSTEFDNVGRLMVRASLTLTLEFPKLAMLLPTAGNCVGRLQIVPIGLSENYKQEVQTPYYMLTAQSVSGLLKSRETFSHKGSYGHALLICGSSGMMGAATLACGGALRSGCGLVTAHVPYQERAIVQVAVPEVIVHCDEGSCFTRMEADISHYSAVGVGCGLGRDPLTYRALENLLGAIDRPAVVDADALNILASRRELLDLLPKNSILTPHPKEFSRLVGSWSCEREKLDKLREFAAAFGVVVVLKGAYTVICAPGGELYFNATGNAGMARGGSGDVLTGLLTGLLARGYDPLSAAMIGVWHHGLAGDRAAAQAGEESMRVNQLIDNISIR